MLPSSHKQNYQEFRALLERLQQTVVISQPEKSVPELAATVYQFFQQQILSLDTSDLEPADAARVQSYHTEMSKQLQLVRMDLMFLQAARQPETAIARQLQIGDRLQTLVSYCNALL